MYHTHIAVVSRYSPAREISVGGLLNTRDLNKSIEPLRLGLFGRAKVEVTGHVSQVIVLPT